MTVIHPSAWIKSCLPVFSFIFFLQIFSEIALKQGLEIPSWDFILQAVKIIFIIWIINTLIYLPIERLWPIHSYCSNLNNVFKKWQNEEKLLPWGLFPGMVRQFDKFRKPDTSLKLMWEEMTQEVKKNASPECVSVGRWILSPPGILSKADIVPFDKEMILELFHSVISSKHCSIKAGAVALKHDEQESNTEKNPFVV